MSYALYILSYGLFLCFLSFTFFFIIITTMVCAFTPPEEVREILRRVRNKKKAFFQKEVAEGRCSPEAANRYLRRRTLGEFITGHDLRGED